MGIPFDSTLVLVNKFLKMGKKQLQVKSHRLPLKRKYTIIKKIKEHKRKASRDLRRNPEKKRTAHRQSGSGHSTSRSCTETYRQRIYDDPIRTERFRIDARVSLHSC